MNITKVNIFFSTLSFVLCIVGYPLVTTLFLPSTSDLSSVTQSVTIPYRAFALAIMLLIIFLNIKQKTTPWSAALVALLLYWLAIVLRIFSDIYLRRDYYFDDTSQLWLYVFGICLAGLYSTMKSYRFIDMDKALQWVYFGVILMLTLTLFSNQALLTNTDSEYRVDGNVALNTIAYGNYGVLGLILSIYILITKNLRKILKVVAILAAILCIYSILRSGSRGPILAFLMVVLFWFFSKGKNFKVGSFFLISSLAILYVLKDFILGLMGKVAPVIEVRLQEALSGEAGPDERTKLHDAAIDIFINHPIIGNQFGIFDNEGGYAYAHNLFLDSFMALGILGGCLMLYIVFKAMYKCYKSVHENRKYYWVSLILVQQLTILMVSGTFYEDQLFSVLLVYHFLVDRISNKKLNYI